MAKNSVRDFDATAANNTDIQSVNIAEGCAPSGINNAIRELMADMKDVSAGTIALESPQADSMTITGDLTVDTSTLKVDSTNNAVGIGVATPSAQLHIQGDDTSNQVIIENTSADATRAPDLLLRRNSSSPADDDEVGQIIFQGRNDNSQFPTLATMRVIYKDITDTTEDAALVYELMTGGTKSEVMRIEGGNVGIGTSTITGKLTLAGDDAFEAITLRDNTSSANMFAITCAEYSGSGGNPNKLSAANSSAISFETSGSERARIDSSGNVLVGTTGLPSSTNKGTALRPVSLDRTIIQMSSASVATGVELIQLRNPNGQVGFIGTNASSTTYQTTSDYRLKENVTGITDGIARIKLLNPSRFNFIVDADTTVDGFLAHEAQEVVPEAVSGEKDAMMDEDYVATPATGEIYTPAQDATFDDNGNELTAAVDEVVHSTDVEQPDTLEEGRQWRETTAAVMATRTVPSYQGIDQSKLVPLLTAALQEAVAEIEALKTRVAALEG